MKKKVFSLMMMLLLAVTGFVRADELTVNDGTTTNGYVPVYGFYADAYLKCEFVQPAADLADVVGGTINGLTFYASQSSVNWGSANFQVFVTEVANASISDFAGPGTVVYTGALSIANGEMAVNFTTPYTYNGGNLLVGVYETVTGSYVTSSWYGVSATGASVQGYSYSGLSDITASQRNFLPKMKIDYTPGSGGGESGEITIHDGGTTNSYVPVYGFYADAYLKAEMVYPASELSVFNGGTINSLKFYTSSAATEAWTSTWQVFVSEVSNATISDFYGPGTVVYEGLLDGTGAEMTINFTTPYQYNGGNLLVGVYNIATGNYKSVSWVGETVNGASVQGYNYSSLNSITATQRNFLPKVTIAYTTAGGGGNPAFVDKLHVKYMDGEEEVVDSLNLGVRAAGAWMEPFNFTMYSEGPTYTVNVLDFTPSDGMFTVEGEELPFQVAPNADVELMLSVNASVNDTGVIERQFVAITEGDRAAHIWPVVVELYAPEVPDVWELAYDFETVAPGFSYEGIPAQITPTTLHNDYTLPFPEIEEGEDAVYKFTVDQDVIINAYVDPDAENGKVALYTEDFYGEGGPMATNNYTGLSIGGGGGAAGAPFEAQIGEGTSTSGYFPFYSLYNYSIAAELFTAAELEEAGVTTAPFTSLSWNATNSISQDQNNITIWMANVSDTQIPATSPLATGMTKVYTGALSQPTPTGWVEFVFNEGSFAWDGHSNVMILCQRNNGSWTSSIQWQYHNPGFAARGYDYTDNAPYDVTTTGYSWYTSSTTRANIIMKGGNRNRNRDLVDFEDGNMPAGWDASQGYNDWYVDTEDYWSSAPAYDGSYSLYVDGNGEYEDDYFISPALEFAGAGSLSFAYTTPSWSGDQNDLTVAYSTSPTGPWTYTSFVYQTSESWTTATVDLSALNGTYYIAFISYDGYGYCTAIDNINITGTTSGGGETPVNPGLEGVSAGPVIENLPLTPGTYYLVASASESLPVPTKDGGPDYTVFINIDEMPCPMIEAEGFAFNPQPADDEDEVEPASVTLRWQVPEYATGWRLVFGSTYYPDPNHPQTILYPEDGSFTNDMANSYTVHNLWNNTNYFWHVEFNNDGCPDGVSSPIWGFTTHLNVPQNLTVVDETVFNDEQIVLNWTAVVDRTYRFYNVYRDGELIGNTQVNNINNTTYTDGPLAYNMDGYTYYVTAVYDEGESAPSNTVTVKVSGYGDVNGHVYEQDGTTGIAGATVTMVGQDEFGVNHTYNFQTNAQGYYSGHIYAGPAYDGQAAKDGYQTAYVPVQGEPIVITYNETTSPIDYIMDENFDPVCGVIAEYYPDSLDPESPYVKVYWGCGLPGSEIIEDFETGDFSKFDWQVDPTYPWTITTNNPYEGTYCMKSGGAGVANVVSNMSVTVEIPADGLMSFFGKISCENSWDYGYFYIDGVQKASFTGAGNWVEKTYEVTAGEHNFKWSYTKDGSVNSNDDCFYVDYINFYKQPEPPVPGMTYNFEDGTMQGWTSVDADGDGYGWYMGSEIMTGQTGNNGSTDFVLSQSYYLGTVLYPDNYLVSPQVQLGGIVRFYACAQDASYAAEHFGLAVSTTNTNPSSFTMIQEWTMTAKSVGEPAGKPIKGQRSGRAQGNWYEYTVDLSAYSGMGYVAIRHFNCSDMFYLNVDDITIGEPGKGMPETRALDHYRVYRTNCYNDGPYTEENTVLLASVWVPDTVYIDVEWAELPAGVYKWGVGSVYSGNRGEEIEGEISWSEPINVNNGEATRSTITCDFESGMPTGWNVIDANNDGLTWCMTSAIPSTWTYYSGMTLDWYHGGSNAICSGSYINGHGAVTPDEYLVSPQVTLGTGASIEFWAAACDASYAADHFGVFISDNGTSNWTSVQEWTMTAKSTGKSGDLRATRDGNGNRLGNWYNYTVDLSAFSGQKYVAIRHFNCYDQYILCVDDITIVEGANGGGGGGGGGTSNGLQLPRESEIVWSNCLDKDMYLSDVDVNVLLNSADSPEGVQVSLVNLNPAEQEMYPVAPVILDETGFYAWDSFRKGEYAVKIDFEGYESIADTVSIWEPTHLRYVMTELFFGIENLYVSRTGWAMWDDSHNNPGGGGGGGGQGGNGDTFSDDFEGGLGNWTIVDADGDGHNWYHSSLSQTYSCYDYTGWGHNESNGFAVSQSYTDCTYDSYDPNNFMITNQKYSISSNSVLNFWADYGNDSYPDHFGVAVATADNPTPADFTIVWEGNAKSGNAGKSQIRHNGDRYFNWRSHSVDLSAYAGQNVYIAFRHFNSYDQYEIYIDDVELTNGAKSGDRHLEYYKVMCTSIDGVPIFNHNTVHPFCQLSTNEPYNAPLVEGEHYLCKVACMYTTGLGAWSEPVEWVYEPCDHWGPVDEVTVNTTGQGNHVQWVFENGFNPYGGETPGPQPGTGDWYYYDNGVNVDAIGLTSGGSFYWGVMFPAGSYEGNVVTKVSMYDYTAHTGNILVYQGGTTAPATLLGQQAYSCTGSEDFVEWEFASPVTIDPSQNLWIVMNNNNGQYVASCCNNTGNVNGRWISLDGASWEDVATYGLDYTWMIRAYVASGAKGESRPISYNGKSSNGGTLAISGNGPRVRTVTENVGFVMLNEGMLEFSIADVANYDARVYFLYNLVNDNRFSVVNSEESGKFLVSSNSNINLKNSFADFIETTMANFGRMNKYQAADFANEYKGSLPMSFVNSMMMDIYAKSRDNSHCADAYPFCTDNGMYEFPAGVNAGSGESGPDYDCLYTTPNPAWYYMRIGNPGNIDIYMYSTPAVDIDFCCWGPFDDPTTPCPNGLTEDKVVSCSYSANPTEHCLIPATAQTGEYYILIITNYSNQACNINFSKVSGSGDTDCGILPPVDIIGFLITEDGEYVAFAGPTDREYTVEGEFGDHEYCVRPIYPGEMTLPDHNYGWSMGCPVCDGGQGGCAPGEPIHAEALHETDQIKIWWGEENPGPGPGGCEGDEFSVNFESGMPAGWTTIDADGDGNNWTLGSVAMGTGYGHNGSSDLILSKSYDNSIGALHPDNWLVSPEVTLCEGSVFSFWACAQDASWAAEHFGVAVSNDNNEFEMIQEWTMTAKGDPYNGPRGTRDQGAWYQYVVNLGDYAGEGRMIAIRHFNCTDMFYLDVDDIELTAGAKTRDGIVKYNVYRSDAAAGEYTQIGEVAAVAGQTYYEYIDTPEAIGTYYYQVRADYGDCESEPAPAFDDPTHDYVSASVDAVNENSDNVALYPNPTKDNVTIEAAGMNRITVVSMLGQVVYDTEVSEDTYVMNMSQFTAGMYMVRVYTENGMTVKRVTVMR